MAIFSENLITYVNDGEHTAGDASFSYATLNAEIERIVERGDILSCEIAAIIFEIEGGK
jgi:hypothetical protein